MASTGTMVWPGWKRWRVITAVAVVVTAACSASAELSQREIEDLFEDGKSLFRQANAAAAEKEMGEASDLYRKSALRFERIVRDGGVENGQLYYNIGNAYFLDDDVGRAILNYRRAEQFIPHDTNLQENLSYALQRRKDTIEERPQKRVMQTLFFWHYDLSFAQRSVVFGATFLLVWAAASLRLFFRRTFLSWLIGVAAAVAVLMLASLILTSFELRNVRPGVVVADEVVARKGDSESYEPAFQQPLHSGTEFRLVESRGDWCQIELNDARRCWLPATAVEMVR